MTHSYINDLCENTRLGARQLRIQSIEIRNAALIRLGQLLRQSQDAILHANALDLEAARSAQIPAAMLDRLTLNPQRIEAMAQGVDEIAAFADPLHVQLSRSIRPNGLEISKVTVPVGSILFIYEARPNVTIDGAALCLKSGNAVILRGGKESFHSSQKLIELVHQAIAEQGIPVESVQLVNTPDRQVVSDLLKRDDALHLVIPRGGESLIRSVSENSRIPVIKHYKGVCHIYIDQSANLQQASEILTNAKVQRPSACNAAETILFDRRLDPSKIQSLLQILVDQGVQVFGDPEICQILSLAQPANPEQWDMEYLDLKISARIVDGVNQAVDHIEQHGSGHTEAILAQDQEALNYFAENVDSSSIMLNASTRFADGGQYGLGAEVGISTDRIHARGPMGVESLCTYKWIVVGQGHIRH